MRAMQGGVSEITSRKAYSAQGPPILWGHLDEEAWAEANLIVVPTDLGCLRIQPKA